MRMVSAIYLAIALAACKAPTSEKAASATAGKPAPPNEETATATATTTATTTDTSTEQDPDDDDAVTGDLALATGDVKIELRAISSTPSFAIANAQANAEVQTPGTLQIMAGLTPWRGEVVESGNGDGGSGIKASSIASGSADGFKIRVHSIRLHRTLATQLRLQADAVVFNDEMLGAIPDLSEEQLATLQGMLGQEYASLDELAEALAAAGLDEAQLSALGDSTENGGGPQGAESKVTIFESEAGVELSLESSSFELGALASALAVPVGSYSAIELQLATKASIKGCVQADFGSVMNDGVALTPGEHKYCTKAGFSLFDAVDASLKQNASFEVGLTDTTTPEWYTIDLRRGPDGSSYPLDGTTQVEYEFETPLVVEPGATLGLTAVVDLNRMLRFYNRGRTSPPNPGMPTDVSYFFTTVFEQSFAVFVGKPGRIYGYALVADACAIDQYDATLAQCGPNNGSVQPNAAWMTIITRPDGSPQRISLMPDDDNGLTITKGDTRGVAQPITAGSAGGLVDIHYALGDEDTGTIIDFPANLEATAIGEVIDGASFEFGDYVGPVTFTRRL